MTHDTRTLRPASAAIAAVLALSSTGLMAQETGAPPPIVAPPNPAPELTAPPPAPSPSVNSTSPIMAPRTTTPATSSPTQTTPRFQSTPTVQALDTEQVATDAEANAERQAAEERVAARAEQARSTPTRRTAPAPAQVAEPATDDPASAAPIEDDRIPTEALLPPADAVAPLASADNGELTETAPADNQGLPMEWLAIAAILGLAIVAGGILLTGRRKRVDEPEPMRPRTGAPIAREPHPLEQFAAATEPRVAPPAREPVRTEPTRSPAVMATGSYKQMLEALVAREPDEQNPFVTRPKRLTRAKWILREHGITPQNTGMTEYSAAPVSTTPHSASQNEGDVTTHVRREERKPEFA